MRGLECVPPEVVHFSVFSFSFFFLVVDEKIDRGPGQKEIFQDISRGGYQAKFSKGFRIEFKGKIRFRVSSSENDFLLFPPPLFSPFFSSPSLISLFKSVMQIGVKRSFAYKVFASKRETFARSGKIVLWFYRRSNLEGPDIVTNYDSKRRSSIREYHFDDDTRIFFAFGKKFFFLFLPLLRIFQFFLL